MVILTLNNVPAIQETGVWSLGWENPNFYLFYNVLHVNNIVLVAFFCKFAFSAHSMPLEVAECLKTCHFWAEVTHTIKTTNIQRTL